MNSKDDNKVEVELHWKSGLRIESEIRQFTPILMDDRKKGKDSAPNPVEMFLSAVGSCLAMSFLYCLHLSGVILDPKDFNVKVSGVLGRVNERLRLINIKTEFKIEKTADRVKIEKCFEKFQPFCILSESIQMGIPFSCDLKIGEK